MTDRPVHARIQATPTRRGLALATLYGLGALLLYLAVSAPPPNLGWLAFLMLTGAGAIYLGEQMRRATAHAIELTDEAVTDTAGNELCRLDQIAGIDRGLFAFKPSNGFSLKLKEPVGRHWSPGLWWRLGRRVGIGGVTPSGEGKFMAEMIAQQLAAEQESSGPE